MILYWLSLFTLIGTLFYAAILDIKYRKVEFDNWYPLIIIGSLSTSIFIYLNFQSFDLMTTIILITTSVIFWLCGNNLKLFGGADAWALIFITIFSITIPFQSHLDNVYTGIGVSTYINCYIIYLLMYPIRKIFNGDRGVPFIVFILLGFLTTIFIGDIYNATIGVLL